jgi:type IV pilus assembly protein PilX
MKRYRLPNHGAQRGMALVSALLLLLVVTIMAVSMFRGYGMQEKIAGNTREKQRALSAAVSAQNYAEWFLSQSGLAGTPVACSAIVPSTTGQVCNNVLGAGDFSITPWAAGVTYTPFTTNQSNGVQSTVGAPTAGVTNSYYQSPVFYITDLGVCTTCSPKGELYQIDALGYGAAPSSVAVVESTYLVSTPAPTNPDI